MDIEIVIIVFLIIYIAEKWRKEQKKKPYPDFISTEPYQKHGSF
jgi:hypothetical protein